MAPALSREHVSVPGLRPGDRVGYSPPPSQGYPQVGTVLRLIGDRAVIVIDDAPPHDSGKRIVYADRLVHSTARAAYQGSKSSSHLSTPVGLSPRRGATTARNARRASPNGQ
jgi:hypothetical protein